MAKYEGGSKNAILWVTYSLNDSEISFTSQAFVPLHRRSCAGWFKTLLAGNKKVWKYKVSVDSEPDIKYIDNCRRFW